jgi:hypothetical protein
VEFQASVGLAEIDAIPAYEAGLTGQGILVGVIDTGIDAIHTDLDANVHPASQDIVSNRADGAGLKGVDTHGTRVSGIIVAEKNDVGMHGVAFNSQVLAIRADTPGTCGSPLGCEINRNEFAAAVDFAIANNVKVLNFSFGVGEGDIQVDQNGNPVLDQDGHVIIISQEFPQETQDALQRALDAGILIVAAAGNFIAEPQLFISQMGLDPANLNQIIVVGATDRNQILDPNSAEAGFAQDIFVSAPTDVLTTTFDNQFVIVNGTSFSAPFVTGMAALLFEMFPNLTAKEVGQIILETATDLGVPGVDDVFGHGLINIARALQPIGPTTLTVSTTGAIGELEIPVADSSMGVGFSFGDAFANIDLLKEVLVLDSFERSFLTDLSGRFLSRTPPTLNMEQFIHSNFQSTNHWLPISPGKSMLFGIKTFTAETDHNFYNRFFGRPVPQTRFAGLEDLQLNKLSYFKFDSKITDTFSFSIATGLDPEDLGTRDNGEIVNRFNFLTRSGKRNSYFSEMQAVQSTGLRIHISEETNLTLVTAFGKYRFLDQPFRSPGLKLKGKAFSTALQLDRTFGRLKLSTLLGTLREDDAILGSLASGALDFGTKSQTFFANFGANLNLGKGFRFAGQYQKGITNVNGNPNAVISGFTNITTSSFSALLTKFGVLSKSDQLGIYIGQPIHVDSGDVLLRLPTERDFSQNRVLFTNLQTGVSPSGREIDYELNYSFREYPLGNFNINLFYQQDAGHIDGFNSLGFAIRWKSTW